MADDDYQLRAPSHIAPESEIAAARVIERALNKTFDGSAGIVGNIFGGAFGDSLTQWRNRRAIDTAQKTAEHLQAKGIPLERAKSLPMGEFIAIFEGCTRQDDPKLTEMWAGLLANAMGGKSNFSVDPSLTRTLEQLSGIDVCILDFIRQYNELHQEQVEKAKTIRDEIDLVTDPDAYSELGRRISPIREQLSNKLNALKKELIDIYSDNNIQNSVINLIRKGLVSPVFPMRIGNELIKLLGPPYRDDIQIDYTQLLHELERIKLMMDIPSENVETDRFRRRRTVSLFPDDRRLDAGTPVPSIQLTGFGKRLLEACT